MVKLLLFSLVSKTWHTLTSSGFLQGLEDTSETSLVALPTERVAGFGIFS